jgi:hypothetical protein
MAGTGLATTDAPPDRAKRRSGMAGTGLATADASLADLGPCGPASNA